MCVCVCVCVSTCLVEHTLSHPHMVSVPIRLHTHTSHSPTLTHTLKLTLISRGGLGEKSGPGVSVRPAHSIHGARPTQYTARCPLNTRRVAHSMHRTYRPVSGLLGKIPIHLTLFWMITKKLHHICFFYNIWIHQFAWVDTWNKMILAIVTLQGRYSFLDEYA